MIPFHHQQEFANQNMSWFATDSQQRYEQNLQDVDHRKVIQDNKWHNSDIRYDFNSHGFRCDEFGPESGFIALGCSTTVGVGLPRELTWSSIVGNQLKIPAWNLAVGGGAMDTNFRLAEYWIPKLTPKFVVLLGTPLRIEIVLRDTIDPLQLRREHRDDWYLKNYTLYDENDRINYRKNIRAISDVCHAAGVPFWHVSVECWGQNSEPNTDLGYDRARDLIHPGPSLHRHFAGRILKEFINA